MEYIVKKHCRQNFQLTLDDSLELKGIALLLLIATHLFQRQYESYYDLFLFPNVNVLFTEFGKLSKVCVAIFLFLSGYGLCKVERNHNKPFVLSVFYKRRFIKLLLNYWYIGIPFVALDILLFRTPVEVYHNNILIKSFLDFFGLSRIFGAASFNPTWWFVTCIMILYLIAPLIYQIQKVNKVVVLCLSFAISYLPFTPWESTVGPYLMPFTFGMIIADMRNVEVWGGQIIYLIFALLIVERVLEENYLFALLIDAFITLMLVFIYKTVSLQCLKKVLRFLGKHSMNIFFFHTFLLIWIPEYVYYLRSPLLIYAAFLSFCIIISILLDLYKKFFGLPFLLSKI